MKPTKLLFAKLKSDDIILDEWYSNKMMEEPQIVSEIFQDKYVMRYRIRGLWFDEDKLILLPIETHPELYLQEGKMTKREQLFRYVTATTDKERATFGRLLENYPFRTKQQESLAPKGDT